ncbi:hypothetical protein LTR78_003030 [Recurvomyces mirabilis]|uniref:Uncharacterized protein n=1 Tax=Recurvomyces mirabilis TaxID=574656 RepID=A0AAE0WRQ8_9PEZI|nr:hypothetical protein LTR78_003030 [Recurvomyces mirabilis]
MAYPKRCDDGKLHRMPEDDQHLGWNSSWSLKDPPSGTRKRVTAVRRFNLSVAVNDNDQLVTPFASQDIEPSSPDRSSTLPSRNATPNTPTPGDGPLDQDAPAISIVNTSTSSLHNGSSVQLERTPAEGQDYQIFPSSRPLAGHTPDHRRTNTTTQQGSRQSPSGIAGNMSLNNHHRAMASLSPSSTILVLETKIRDDIPAGRGHYEMFGSSDASDAESGRDDPPYKMIAGRAREKVVRLTATVESSNHLLQRLGRRHEFDTAELARSQALSAQLKQERDAAVAEADGQAAAVAAGEELAVAKKDGHIKILRWSLVLFILAVVAYMYWCWRNSAEFLYIREVRRKFYDTGML